ncbi:hypothetical protein [Indioceanicola profundi]|uniref:hypothetical protein n=1 Tax=Indioceanicola profundi TaxID=2220096 RepID=UPI000E6AD48B|nr:hypothetical protein [Indioceanicola profundi]
MKMVGTFAPPAILAGLALLLPAAPATAQLSPPMQPQEYGCEVDTDSPCRGRIDFSEGDTYEFRFAGPGTALVQNEGNRRCILEFSMTDGRSARTGRQLNITPGQVAEVPVPDTQGMIMRFTYRGASSNSCDLLIALRQ